MPEFGLPDATLLRIRQILADCPAVEKAVLYGSRAMGTHRPGSDIDLTLFGEQLHPSHLAHIARQLDESPIPYQVDLSLWNQLDLPALREHIQRVGQPLYQREHMP